MKLSQDKKVARRLNKQLPKLDGKVSVWKTNSDAYPLFIYAEGGWCFRFWQKNPGVLQSIEHPEYRRVGLRWQVGAASGEVRSVAPSRLMGHVAIPTIAMRYNLAESVPTPWLFVDDGPAHSHDWPVYGIYFLPYKELDCEKFADFLACLYWNPLWWPGSPGYVGVVQDF